jgi:flagellin
MTLSVNSSASALLALLGTQKAVKEANEAMERLSTGKRINSAKDDAAGVAISSRLDSSVRGLKQSISNALDAQALIDTAEGGMQETETILQRIRELSIQASNDTNSADDRANLNAEAQSLLSEIDRISSSTTWAGQSLLDGTFTDKSFQVGTGTMAADQLVISISGASSGYLGLSGSSGSTITTPQKIGSEFQVNTTTTGYQYSPVTTNLENGNFIIAWASEAQDGSVEGSYGQIYSPSGQK